VSARSAPSSAPLWSHGAWRSALAPLLGDQLEFVDGRVSVSQLGDRAGDPGIDPFGGSLVLAVAECDPDGGAWLDLVDTHALEQLGLTTNGYSGLRRRIIDRTRP
jgi:hypothetical protein